MWRRLNEIFLCYLVPIITVLTIDILVMARLDSLMPMKYCVLVVVAGTTLGPLIGIFSDKEV